MNIEDYENIEDGISVEKLNSIYDVFFKETDNESQELSIEKLEILSEKQWHTYENPKTEVQENLKKWLYSNWVESDEYLELVMVVCYSFALDKDIYAKALNSYTGDYRAEFLKDIENSKGDYIDPYWSMRKQK